LIDITLLLDLYRRGYSTACVGRASMPDRRHPTAGLFDVVIRWRALAVRQCVIVSTYCWIFNGDYTTACVARASMSDHQHLLLEY
jgi:hypothetical protein